MRDGQSRVPKRDGGRQTDGEIEGGRETGTGRDKEKERNRVGEGKSTKERHGQSTRERY